MKNEKSDFHFKKEFGQNFIFDTNFLSSVVGGFGLEKNTNVLEIGAGMGSLSRVLAGNFRRVVSFEIDKTLTEKLQSVAKEFDNLTFVIADILKTKTAEIEKMFCGEDYVIIANIPYYITSQIVFKFLFETLHLTKMFVLVQKEVAERFCAEAGDSARGIPSVLLSAFGECKMIKFVPRKMFVPVPKVDSCVVGIDINREKFGKIDTEKFELFVKKCFNMKRKTLINNLLKLPKEKDEILSVFAKMSLPENIRAEELSTEQFVEMFKMFSA